MCTNLSLGGEVETLWFAKPPCAGSIPAQDSRIKIIFMIFIRESWEQGVYTLRRESKSERCEELFSKATNQRAVVKRMS